MKNTFITGLLITLTGTVMFGTGSGSWRRHVCEPTRVYACNSNSLNAANQGINSWHFCQMAKNIPTRSNH